MIQNIQHRGQELHTPRRIVKLILTNDLHLRPYKIQLTQVEVDSAESLPTGQNTKLTMHRFLVTNKIVEFEEKIIDMPCTNF